GVRRRESGGCRREWATRCRTGPASAATVRTTATPPPPSLHEHSTRHDSHCLMKGVELGLGVAREDHFLQESLALQRIAYHSHRNDRGLVHRESGQARADRRKSDALATIVVRDLERVLVRQ